MESKKINQLATNVAPQSTDLTIIGDPITGVSKKITWLQVSTLIGTAANLQQVTDNGATTTNPIAIGGLTITGLATGVLKSNSGVIASVPFGAANGVATLGGDGKVPSSQLPSYVDDVVEVANYAALPAIGETGKIYITLDTNKVYRWTGSIYVEIAANNAVWGAITGTLSNQTDLQNALNTKLSSVGLSMPSGFTVTNSPLTANGTIAVTGAGNSTQYLDGTGALQTFPTLLSSDNLVKLVRNQSGATMTAGTVIYISGATGNKPLIAKALATGDATSAQTYGIVQANIANNADGYIVIIGNVGDLDTSALTEGQQLYLSATTAGAYTTTKQYAPNHLVYVGIVLRSHPTQGIIGVKIQNGYEMDELHNVAAQSPSNGDILQYVSSTSLWTKTAGTTTNIAEGTNLYFTDTRARNAISLTTTGTSGAATYSGGVLNIPNYGSALSDYVTLATSQTITGYKDFNGETNFNNFVFNNSKVYNYQSSVFLHSATLAFQSLATTMVGVTNGIKFGLGSLATTQFTFNNTVGLVYTFPAASGTLALTSDLSSYLPLTGGTLTGALGGTSATFSAGIISTVSDGNYFLRTEDIDFNNHSISDSIRLIGRTNAAKALFYFGSTGNNYFGYNGTAFEFSGSNVGIGTSSPNLTAANRTVLDLNGTNESLLAFSNGGTLRGYIYNTATDQIYWTDGARNMQFGIAGAGFMGFGTNNTERMRITSGGNVGIGTSSPESLLQVGAFSGNNALTIGGGTTGVSSLYFGDGSGAALYRGFIEYQHNGDYMRFGTSAAEAMRITSDGRFLVGATATDSGCKARIVYDGINQNGMQLFDSTNNTSSTIFHLFGINNPTPINIGAILRASNTNAVLYSTTSDYRLKEDYKEIKGLNKVLAIKVYDFKWKGIESRMDGVIAHELAEVLPYAVHGEKDGESMQGVDYSKIVPVLVKAIQELNEKIKQLENK